MGQVRVDLNISLDGYATTTDQTPEDPIGKDWNRLVAAYVATRTMQERVFGQSGEGTTGLDDDYAAAYFEGIGAEIMGAGMFGLHAHPGDLDWQGWWGPNPPFGVPVFVLTHEQRPTLEMEGGTTFHFVQTLPSRPLPARRRSRANSTSASAAVPRWCGITWPPASSTDYTSGSHRSCSAAACGCGRTSASWSRATRSPARSPPAERST